MMHGKGSVLGRYIIPLIACEEGHAITIENNAHSDTNACTIIIVMHELCHNCRSAAKAATREARLSHYDHVKVSASITHYELRPI